jgi:cyclophilin family peptidyl-prolyl cis-trans isomerase
MDRSNDVYTKAAFIEALSYDPLNYPSLEQKGLKSNENVLSTAATLALSRVLTSDKFDQIYRTMAAKEKVTDDLRQYFVDIFRGRNEGSMAAAASILRDETFPFKEEVTIKSSIREALLQLDLPRQLETKYEMERTLAYMEGKEYIQAPFVYNHPIDWTLVNSISDSSRVFIVTNKGQIELELYHHHAPGSVANFVKLVNDNYYDNNTIHRVVPNFVVQAGCPRGDGYGSLDYTIRSELGPKYYDDEGYIGMASAGPDTEGTQWFITHSPTPHLDGRYTIFGKVLSGMDVVHSLQIGDKIQDIRILKS